MNKKIMTKLFFTVAAYTFLQSVHAFEGPSTRIGNVVECHQENNNGNGLYVKRESCYRWSDTYGHPRSECNFRAFFTAEGGKDSKSVIQGLRELSVFPENAEKYTNLYVVDYGNVKFEGILSKGDYSGLPEASNTTSYFRFLPVDNNGRFSLDVRIVHQPKNYGEREIKNFNYIYNCSYIP